MMDTVILIMNPVTISTVQHKMLVKSYCKRDDFDYFDHGHGGATKK